MLVAIGCGALFAARRLPIAATVTATLAYGGFLLRDYEFGMSLPAMVAVFLLVADGGRRTVAILAAVGCFAVSLLWVSSRAAPVTDPGVAMLIWVAFGTVTAAFFAVPILVAEIVRARRPHRAGPLRQPTEAVST